MKKRNVQIILILLTGSMLAIVIAQLLWVSDAFRLKDANFRNQVDAALKEVNILLEDRFTSISTFNKIQLQPGESIILVQSNSDSTLDTVSQFIRNYTYTDTNFAYKKMSSPLATTVELNLKYHYLPDSVNLSPDKSEIRRKQAENIFQGDYELSNFFELSHISKYLDSILKMNLVEQGISSEYYYAIRTKNSKNYIVKHPETFQPEKFSDQANSQTIFTNSSFYLPHELIVVFPQKGKYLLSSMSALLVASILIILIMTGVLYFVARTILRQKKLSEMKNDFINNMTHEFKTPIANISLALDTIAGTGSLNGSIKLLNIIKAENERMHDNVEKILTISMLGKDELRLEKTDIDVHDLLIKAARSFQLLVQKREGDISIDFKAEESNLEGDEIHLANVFYNLLDNAIKYNKENPVIQIRTYNRANELIVEVQDNGLGISKEDQERIFEKFFRVHSGDKHDVKGFGLGLSYVNQVVEQHRGSIRLKSQLNKGSTFIVTLPINKSSYERQDQNYARGG